MSISVPSISLAGASGPYQAATQIAAGIAASPAGDDSSTATALQLAVLEKALQATKASAVDLQV